MLIIKLFFNDDGGNVEYDALYAVTLNLIQDGGGNVEFDAKFTVTLNLIQGLFCLVKYN